MDVCRRDGCGHQGQAHEHYHAGTSCVHCECPAYRRYRRPSQHPGRRVLAAAACSVAAAGLAGSAWWRMASGYHGPALVWLGLGSIGFVITGANIADRKGQ
jgi:hypothetical protein